MSTRASTSWSPDIEYIQYKSKSMDGSNAFQTASLKGRHFSFWYNDRSEMTSNLSSLIILLSILADRIAFA